MKRSAAAAPGGRLAAYVLAGALAIRLARRILADRLERIRLGKASAEEQRIEKMRRQKRKRSKRAKARMLADKRHHSAKKDLRRGPRD